MKITVISILACLALTEAARITRDGARSLEPPCSQNWTLTPCTCNGRPGTPDLECSGIESTDSMKTVMAAAPEGVSFRSIEIHGSGLTELPAGIFGEHNFYLFMLNDNKIQAVDKEAFKGSEDSTELIRLQDNSISNFSFESLQKLTNLKVLQLSKNQLTQIPDNAFPLLPNLQMVDLSGNQISSVGTKAFYRLPQLARINLANNQLTNLAADSLAIDQSEVPFQLILANNSISKIDKSAFAGLKLQLLDLSNNKLESLPQDVFEPLLRANDTVLIIVEENPLKCEGDSMAWMKQLSAAEKQKLKAFAC